MNDRDEKPFLQRRGGRRVSIPSSPISPILPKRNERIIRSPEVNSNFDVPPSSDVLSDQPTDDNKIKSQTLNGPSFASSASGDGSPWLSSIHMATTEELERSKSLDQIEPARGSFLTSRPDNRQPQNTRPSYLTELSSRSSPLIGRVSEGRDRTVESSASNARNYSTTSLSTDKSASDENIAAKAPITKKSRLNLLNPMSLLARRRSSQNTKVEEMNVNITPLHVPAIPENFDPSIRGNFVHDFSTPRNKRSHFENSPRREGFSSPATTRRPSDFGSPGTYLGSSPFIASHSPIFKENFQDDDHTLQPGQTAYLHNVANSHKLFDSPSSASLPSFAKNLPKTIPEPEQTGVKKAKSPVDVIHSVPHPEAPPPPPPERTPSPVLDLPSASTLPKHMTSVSSRFSFQIAGPDSSAQERLLEERHKEHFAKDVGKTAIGDIADHDYDDYDFDGDDDFEEKIPGVNTDFDDDDGFYNDDIPIRNIDVQSSQQLEVKPIQLLNGFHFTPNSSTFSPHSADHTAEPTPRDVQGFRIGVADTKYSPVDTTHADGQETDEKSISPVYFEGLRISTGDQDRIANAEITPPPDNPQQSFDDMDLYFDDGEFDMDQIESDSHFDENLLDDETGKIRDIPAENLRRYEAALERGGPSDLITVVDPGANAITRDTSSSSNYVDVRVGDSSGISGSREHETTHGVSNHAAVLTEGNLAAYHSALAEAANHAAMSGKFNRQVSFRSGSSEEAEQIQVGNGLTGVAIRGLGSQNDGDSEYLDDYETFAFEDDDQMIAEANAEALENDDDGFYGQEFGFYARAHGKEVSDQVNGGFFAARGSNGIKRSHSGKANFQEPSLTPITERSEWSTRNSVASLQFGSLPNVAQSLPSPGISQLLEGSLDSPIYEDEMSILMRLRRGTFGGSSTSINSLGERSVPGSSPLANITHASMSNGESKSTLKQNGPVYHNLFESEEEEELEMDLPTITQNTPHKPAAGSSTPGHYSQMTHLSVNESPTRIRKSRHRRNSSGADSVSYVRDNDGQWVLERRRTGEDGEQEIVEREYLAGARI